MPSIRLSLLLVLALSTSGMANVKVIYGDDNRVDVINSDNALFVELARSTAAMIPHGRLDLVANSGEYKVSGRTLEQRGMCASERFSNQVTAANCSGFLVGDKYLVTAGHCITTNSDCRNNAWVFDYAISDENSVDEINVPEQSVYRCSRIVSRSLNNSTMDDYALLELDREVTDRAPLSFRRQGRPDIGDELVVIGHPSGLPTKIADGAVVRTLQNKYFSANLDTYGGNSGSAVFNTTTGEVEGILVRGATDYVFDSSQGCRISNELANNAGRGEDVTYITNIEELMDM